MTPSPNTCLRPPWDLGSDARTWNPSIQANSSSMSKLLSVHQAVLVHPSALFFQQHVYQSPRAELCWTDQALLRNDPAESPGGCLHCCESELSMSHAFSWLQESLSSEYHWFIMTEMIMHIGAHRAQILSETICRWQQTRVAGNDHAAVGSHNA